MVNPTVTSPLYASNDLSELFKLKLRKKLTHYFHSKPQELSSHFVEKIIPFCFCGFCMDDNYANESSSLIACSLLTSHRKLEV